jgi:hypothetical protein
VPSSNINMAAELKAAFEYNKNLAERAIAQLSDKHLHVALHPETNAITVIMKHVAGNLRSRWSDFLTSDGEKPSRNRDEEFVDTFVNRQDLLADWDAGWRTLFSSLDALSNDDFNKFVTIRGANLSVPLAIGRSLSHCGYHVGQIVMVSRILADDAWQTLTIPRGASQQHNTTYWGNRQQR